MGKLTPNSAASAATPRVDTFGVVVFDEIVIPRTSVRARMRVVTRGEALAAKAQAKRTLEAAGLPADPSVVMGAYRDEWNAELALQNLAIAVRCHDKDEPLASAAEWRSDCDDDQIGALWIMYEDLRSRIDPLGKLEELSEADVSAMHDASKKKDADSLMSYGSRKLAAYAITTAAQPAI
jgi:hypothetical protein